ncbi:MAG: flagellar motor switch phosphatase FliY [Bacilli bacterium]
MQSLNKDFLSPEEINALMANGPDRPPLNPDDHLSLFDRDALGETGNICFGTAATTLSTLLRQKVTITTPEVSLLRKDDVSKEFPIPHVAAHVLYTQGLEGSNVLAIRVDDAQIIADLMLGGDGTSPAEELNDLHLSAVAEAMNQMMGSAATSMSTMINRTINISPPTVRVVDLAQEVDELLRPRSEILVKVSFHLQVGSVIDSHIMQLYPLAFAQLLVEMLVAGEESGAGAPDGREPVAGDAAAAAATGRKQAVPDSRTPVAARAADAQTQMAATRAAAAYAGSAAFADHGGRTVYGLPDPSEPVVERAVFSVFDETEPLQKGGQNLELLLDIPLSVTVELGRAKRLIRDILNLAPGAILELDKLAGEPVDILVNNKLIAKGEVVVIDENFGVRVTDILSPAERVKRLQ